MEPIGAGNIWTMAKIVTENTLTAMSVYEGKVLGWAPSVERR